MNLPPVNTTWVGRNLADYLTTNEEVVTAAPGEVAPKMLVQIAVDGVDATTQGWRPGGIKATGVDGTIEVATF